MGNTIILNSGQKIEVLLQDEVSLDINCSLRYIKSGEQEINTYVKNTAQPHLDNVITQAQTAMANQIAAGIENAAKAAIAAAAQEINVAKEEINSYTQQHIIPELNGILSDAEDAAAAASTKAQNATNQAETAAGSAAAAQVKAAAAAASADLAETWAEQVKETARKLSNGLNLFDVKWSDHLLESISWLRGDTFSWQSGTVYTAAYNELLAEYNNEDAAEETENGIIFKRTPKGYKIAASNQEEAVLELYNTTGVAWYYILDTENQRFKLPHTKYGFNGLRDNVGDYIPESLPNIVGTLGATGNQMVIGWQDNKDVGTSGVFSASNRISYGGFGNGNGYANRCEIDFTASGSSSAYQDNAPVQERATQMYLYFYVGNYDRPTVEQTAGLNTELFNGKADNDLNNVTSAAKHNVINWGIPDMSTAISIAALPFVAPYNCYVNITAERDANTTSYGRLSINGVISVEFYSNQNTQIGTGTVQRNITAGTTIALIGNARLRSGYYCKFLGD